MASKLSGVQFDPRSFAEAWALATAIPAPYPATAAVGLEASGGLVFLCVQGTEVSARVHVPGAEATADIGVFLNRMQFGALVAAMAGDSGTIRIARKSGNPLLDVVVGDRTLATGLKSLRYAKGVDVAPRLDSSHGGHAVAAADLVRIARQATWCDTPSAAGKVGMEFDTPPRLRFVATSDLGRSLATDWAPLRPVNDPPSPPEDWVPAIPPVVPHLIADAGHRTGHQAAFLVFGADRASVQVFVNDVTITAAVTKSFPVAVPAAAALPSANGDRDRP